MTLALLALTALPFVVSPGASFAITVDAVSKGDFRAPTKVWAGTSVGIVAVVSVAALSGLGSFLDDHQTTRQDIHDRGRSGPDTFWPYLGRTNPQVDTETRDIFAIGTLAHTVVFHCTRHEPQGTDSLRRGRSTPALG